MNAVISSATLRSTTNRCWSVPQSLSIRPFACGERALMGEMPRMSRALPNWVSPSLAPLSSSTRVSLSGLGEKKMEWASESMDLGTP
jgi:hypothetical protein